MPQFRIYMSEEIYQYAQKNREEIKEVIDKHINKKKRDCYGKGVCKVNY